MEQEKKCIDLVADIVRPGGSRKPLRRENGLTNTRMQIPKALK